MIVLSVINVLSHSFTRSVNSCLVKRIAFGSVEVLLECR